MCLIILWYSWPLTPSVVLVSDWIALASVGVVSLKAADCLLALLGQYVEHNYEISFFFPCYIVAQLLPVCAWLFDFIHQMFVPLILKQGHGFMRETLAEKKRNWLFMFRMQLLKSVSDGTSLHSLLLISLLCVLNRCFQCPSYQDLLKCNTHNMALMDPKSLWLKMALLLAHYGTVL